MKYALNLSEDYRILSASFFNEFSPEDAVAVDALPEGNIADYRYVDGEFIHDPLPEPEQPEFGPTAQADADAMLVDHEYRLTMLELGLV